MIIILLITYKFFEKNVKNIKISVYLPLYNMEKYIVNAIHSIKRQTLKDIEIIAVNDYSTDNTYNILKDFSTRDQRIKIINNTKNSGLLYSRAMGIIHSSGNYLLNLDGDDEFNDIYDLEYLYNIAITYNADIVSFSYMTKRNRKIKNLCNEFHKIIKQPKLFESSYQDDKFPKLDTLIWNKLIKKEIYLKAYNLFKNFIYYKKWNYYEDNIWSLLVHKVANSKICVNKLIYIYNTNLNKASLMKKRRNLLEFKNTIYKFEMTKKIFDDQKSFKYLYIQCISLFKKINTSLNYKNNIKNDFELKNRIINNLNGCIKDYYISKFYQSIALNIINLN